MPIYLEEGIAELIEGYDEQGKLRLQADRMRAVGRQAIRGKRVLPATRAPGRASSVSRSAVYGNRGRHWYDVGYGLALYYHRQDRLPDLLTGRDNGALNVEHFHDFLADMSAWNEAQPASGAIGCRKLSGIDRFCSRVFVCFSYI